MKITDRLPAMSLAVVGAGHANKDKSNRQFEILLCRPGEPVELLPEPKNPHDENAIAVVSERGVQLGYLSAERAPRIGQLMRQGREIQAVFQRPSRFGAWIRVAFDGEVPIVADLPAEPLEEFVGAQAEPDFYPDEIWPDE